MNLIQQIVSICRNCASLVPISLPHPTREGTRPNQVASAPTENARSRLLVACPSCAVVYACSERDLDRYEVEMSDLPLDRLRPSLIRARRNCGTKKCGTPIEIHTVVASGMILSELCRISSTWNFRELFCLRCRARLQECLSGDYQFEGFEPPTDLN